MLGYVEKRRSEGYLPVSSKRERRSPIGTSHIKQY